MKLGKVQIVVNSKKRVTMEQAVSLLSVWLTSEELLLVPLVRIGLGQSRCLGVWLSTLEGTCSPKESLSSSHEKPQGHERCGACITLSEGVANGELSTLLDGSATGVLVCGSSHES